MGIYIKLKETYPAKESVLGDPVKTGNKSKKVIVYKDKWTEVPKITHQMFRLREYIDVFKGANPNKKEQKKAD